MTRTTPHAIRRPLPSPAMTAKVRRMQMARTIGLATEKGFVTAPSPSALYWTLAVKAGGFLATFALYEIASRIVAALLGE